MLPHLNLTHDVASFNESLKPVLTKQKLSYLFKPKAWKIFNKERLFNIFKSLKKREDSIETQISNFINQEMNVLKRRNFVFIHFISQQT